MLSNALQADRKHNPVQRSVNRNRHLGSQYFRMYDEKNQLLTPRSKGITLIHSSKDSSRRKGISLSLKKRKEFSQLYGDGDLKMQITKRANLHQASDQIIKCPEQQLKTYHHLGNPVKKVSSQGQLLKISNHFGTNRTTTCNSNKPGIESRVVTYQNEQKEPDPYGLAQQNHSQFFKTKSLLVETSSNHQTKRLHRIFDKKKSRHEDNQDSTKKIRTLDEAPLYYSIIVDDSFKQSKLN